VFSDVAPSLGLAPPLSTSSSRVDLADLFRRIEAKVMLIILWWVDYFSDYEGHSVYHPVYIILVESRLVEDCNGVFRENGNDDTASLSFY
jgi:hypothetical protein